ncbi:MAG: hypothetical protein QOD00_659 [Blastocatellia bacterium]|jgi:hypothetical protein|nr:hypothetical protein [Blastocatellia bacterium]
MFGLGKVLGGGIFGKFFDSIGMSWMNNIISLAVNITTGNWLAAAEDVFNLVSQFSSNNAWQNRVAQQPPLGQFGSRSCFGTDSSSLSSSRMDDLFERTRRDDLNISTNTRTAFNVVSTTIDNRQRATSNLQVAYSTSRV